MNSHLQQSLRVARLRTVVQVAWVILIGSVGCGPPLGTLEGNVTFEGDPVTGGFVLLFPTDGNYRNTSSVRVVDGRYRITGIVPGQRRVGLENLQLSPLDEDQARLVPDVTGSFPETITVAAGAARLDLELRAATKNRKGKSQP